MGLLLVAGGALPNPVDAAPQEEKVSITPNEDGFFIDNGSGVTFTMRYPVFMSADGKEVGKITDKLPSDTTAMVTYDSGAQIDFAVDDRVLSFQMSNVPPEVKYYEFTTYINFKYAEGGSWQINDAPRQPFPPEKPEDAQLFQGEGKVFTLRESGGMGLSVELPLFSHNQLTDNREWGWQVFVWRFHPVYNPDHPNDEITFSVVAEN